MLPSVFTTLFSKFFPPEACEDYWLDLSKKYTGKGRYYHNLDHLEFLLNILKPIENRIEDWEILLVTLFYHDYIYKVTRKDNELKSAICAEQLLKKTTINASRIKRCYKQIIATKNHLLSEDQDSNYFNDADLAILGSTPDSYSKYVQKIRNEYHIYPDFLYIPGRRKVINHFLEMNQIYKTTYFRDTLESQARYNLKNELKNIS